MRTVPIVVVAIVTSSVTTASTFFLLRALSHGTLLAGEKIDVPPLGGLTADQARSLLEPKGLSLVVSEMREDPKAPSGAILAQSPLEGTKVEKGAEVRVVVSKGEAQVEVPVLAGMEANAGMQLLAKSNLRTGKVTRTASDRVPKDRVVSTTPEGGAQVASGSAVDLVVSGGASGAPGGGAAGGAAVAAGGDAVIPMLVGKESNGAKREIEKAGLKVGKITFGHDEDRRGGVVIKQSPAPGGKAAPGTAVDLVVNEDS
jgi:eukaryotic-like serine/threonine-protein kinase